MTIASPWCDGLNVRAYSAAGTSRNPARFSAGASSRKTRIIPLPSGMYSRPESPEALPNSGRNDQVDFVGLTAIHG